MLILQMNVWDIVRFHEADGGLYLGSIKRFPNKSEHKNQITMAFSFPRKISILRDELIAPEKGDNYEI